VQPVVVVTDAMKIFSIQCQQLGIRLNFVEDETLRGFEWVMLDPSRLTQVLINLLYVTFAMIHATTDIPKDKCYQVHQG
jgi:C4-dicarboxylate-specific signal transduction histidine kinase